MKSDVHVVILMMIMLFGCKNEDKDSNLPTNVILRDTIKYEENVLDFRIEKENEYKLVFIAVETQDLYVSDTFRTRGKYMLEDFGEVALMIKLSDQIIFSTQNIEQDLIVVYNVDGVELRVNESLKLKKGVYDILFENISFPSNKYYIEIRRKRKDWP